MRSVEISTNNELAARIAATCVERGLLAPRDRVLVAASAGADSTALAVLLHEARHHDLPLELTLAYVDHGWRGPAEADLDFAAVEQLADRLGVDAVRSPCPSPGTPRTEDAARRHRYGWLGRAAVEHGISYVAVAHHLGDQAETFLMRLLRGSGIVGLAGIPWRRPLGSFAVEVVRPLLDTDPGTLRAYLRVRGIPWREDPTNLDVDRDRARIRARIARLSGSQPDAARRLALYAARLRRRVEAREASVVALARGRIQHWPWADAVSMSRDWIAGLRSPVLVALAVSAAGKPIQADRHGPWLTRRHAVQMLKLARRGGAVDLPHGLRFRVAGTQAWLRRVSPDPRLLPTLHVDTLPRDALDLDAFLERPIATRGVALDADRLGGAPNVRRVEDEDTFIPFGRCGRHPVRVVDWLGKRGVPGFARRGTLVVEGAAGVAWVVGQRIDQAHAVTEATRQVSRVRLG